jgi:putative membrane protein
MGVLQQSMGGAMRVDLRFVTMGILATALSLPVFGCQRANQNVQAARDTTNTEDRGNHAVLNDADKNFLKKAEEQNIKEELLGRAVVRKTKNTDVRDYAQMLTDDHAKGLKELVDLMHQKNMRQARSLPKLQHEALSKLNRLSEPEFDREFINQMIEDHQVAVTEFRQEVNTARDNAVKNYASHMLPILEKHLQKARELQAKPSNGPNTR